jgi:uncharacterized membrane protein
LFKVLHRTAVAKDGRLLSGGMLAGWGLFNLIEGIIYHQLLKLHNVYEYTPNKEVYNMIFLLSGIVLIGLGWMFSRRYFRGPQDYSPVSLCGASTGLDSGEPFCRR